MGSILGSLGGSSSKTTSTSGQAFPLNIRGSRGALLNIDNGTGQVNLSRGVGKRRNQLFSDIQGITRDVQNDILSLRSLENPFVRARVRPTEERFANLRSDTERGLARRGVFGTFNTNELTRVDDAASKQIADQTAIAHSEVLNAVLQRQSFLSSLNSQLSNLNEAEVRQALAELGLGAQSAASLVRQQSQESETSDTGKGLQTAASLAGAAAAFFSDRRLKRDILRIGSNGPLGVYQFKYLWSDQVYEGYMADEVAACFPEAVSEIGGYLAVNYGAL